MNVLFVFLLPSCCCSCRDQLRWCVAAAAPPVVWAYILSQRRAAMIALFVGVVVAGDRACSTADGGRSGSSCPTAFVLGLGFVAATWNATRRARPAGAGGEDGALPRPARRGRPQLGPLPPDRGLRPLVHDPVEPDLRRRVRPEVPAAGRRSRTSASSSSGSTSPTTRCCGSGSRPGFFGFVAMLFLFARGVQLRHPLGARRSARTSTPRSCSPGSPTSSCSSSSPTSTSPGTCAARCSSPSRSPCAPTSSGPSTTDDASSTGVHTMQLRDPSVNVRRCAGGGRVGLGGRSPPATRGGGELQFDSAPEAASTLAAPSAATSQAPARRAPPVTATRRAVRRRQRRPPSRPTSPSPSTPPRPGPPISPLILGFSSALTADELRDAGISFNSWGGNPATRYNYEIGHAWNHGADFEFRNTNYGDHRRRVAPVPRRQRGRPGSTAGSPCRRSAGSPATTTTATCSFPDGDGGCLSGEEVGDCAGDGPRSPILGRANVESTPEQVADWIDGTDRRRAAPSSSSRWTTSRSCGAVTHYDVHPDCPTYEEILDKYLDVRPRRARRRARRRADRSGDVLLVRLLATSRPGRPTVRARTSSTWFLTQRRAPTTSDYGQRTLDVVDVHYYPQSDVYNDDDRRGDERPAAAQHPVAVGSRSTSTSRGSTEPIRFIPRHEGDDRADLSRDAAVHLGVELRRRRPRSTARWRSPTCSASTGARACTPPPTGATRPSAALGGCAFKMHGNYDGEGSRFGGLVAPRHEQRRGRAQRVRRARRGDGDGARDADQQAARRCIERRRGAPRRRADGGPALHVQRRRSGRRSCPARRT